MIIVPLKEGENIERALKKFKRKFEKTGIVKELRDRQAFTKPSVRNRAQRINGPDEGCLSSIFATSGRINRSLSLFFQTKKRNLLTLLK